MSKHLQGPGRRIAKWVVRTIAALLALYALFIIIVCPLSFPFIGLILFGWIGFLWRVLPMVTFNAQIAWAAAVSLSLALFGLHWLLRSLRKHREGASARWRFAWTWKFTVLGLLLFPAAIAAVGTVHQIAWLHTGPGLVDWRGTRSLRENSIGGALMQLDLQEIGQTLNLFAKDHQDQLPASLYELVPRYVDSCGRFFEPAEEVDEPPLELIYYPGHRIGDKADTIILAYPVLIRSSQGDKRVVVHLDSSTALLSEAEFQEKIAKQRAQASTH